jgi:hypothetical protein
MSIVGVMDESGGALSGVATQARGPGLLASSSLPFSCSRLYFFFYSYLRSFAVRPGEASA